MGLARGDGPDVLGVLLVLGAAAGYGVYIVVSNRYVHRAGPLISTAWVALGASVSFGLTGLFTRSWVVPATLRAGVLLVGLIVFSTILPLATFFAGMRRVGPTAASLLSTLEPVFTILMAALFLHEALTRNQWAGGALILAAVVLLNLPTRRAPPDSGPPRGACSGEACRAPFSRHRLSGMLRPYGDSAESEREHGRV